MATNGVEVIPGANRLIRSLRDMGYEFPTAVADLVDNAIEAGASSVQIKVHWQGEDSYVLIADNGKGMSAAELREAMRYGAERDYQDEDLGKFGLGLKTASMSQCSKLTVASRFSATRADVSSYCWDLHHIGKTNRWEILPVRPTSLPAPVRQHLKETPGTVIVWQQLERILGYKHKGGEFARKHLIAICRELEEHLGMVFHRFLSGEIRGKKLAIYLNGNKVLPWDPFARDESKTEKLEEVTLRVETDTTSKDVILQPYVLPHQSQFSTPEAHGRASGPNKWNRQQGFYIYRAGRMIQSGGWSNLRTLDEHLKLARVALSFTPKLDEAFKINVAKMRVQLPASIRDEIQKAIGPAIRLADQRYRKGGEIPGIPPSPKPRPTHTPTNPTNGSSATTMLPVTGTGPMSMPVGIPPSADDQQGTDDVDRHTLARVFAAVNEEATEEERPVIRRLFERVQAKFRLATNA